MTHKIDTLVAFDVKGRRVPLPNGKITLSGYMMNNKICPDKINYAINSSPPIDYIEFSTSSTMDFRRDTLRRHKLI